MQGELGVPLSSQTCIHLHPLGHCGDCSILAASIPNSQDPLLLLRTQSLHLVLRFRESSRMTLQRGYSLRHTHRKALIREGKPRSLGDRLPTFLV